MTDRGSYRDAGESIRHRVEEMRRSAPSARVVLTPLRRAALPPQVTVELERLFGLLGQDVSDAAGLAGIEVLLRELEDQIAVATSALERAKSRLVKHVAVPRGPRVPWWLPSMLEAPMHHVLRHRLQHHDAKVRSWLPSTDAAFASFTDGDTPLLLLGRTTAERGKLGAVREDDSEFALRVPVLDGFALTVTPRAQFERLLRRVGEPFGLGALPARADTEFDSLFRLRGDGELAEALLPKRLRNWLCMMHPQNLGPQGLEPGAPALTVRHGYAELAWTEPYDHKLVGALPRSAVELTKGLWELSLSV